jgi:hypothetical protein
LTDELDPSIFSQPLPEFRDREIYGSTGGTQAELEQARAEAAHRLSTGKGSYVLVMAEDGPNLGEVEEMLFLCIETVGELRLSAYRALLHGLREAGEKIGESFWRDIAEVMSKDDSIGEGGGE